MYHSSRRNIVFDKAQLPAVYAALNSGYRVIATGEEQSAKKVWRALALSRRCRPHTTRSWPRAHNPPLPPLLLPLLPLRAQDKPLTFEQFQRWAQSTPAVQALLQGAFPSDAHFSLATSPT